MKIDKRMNLVIPIERDDGPIYVHSTPISQATFEQNFVAISRTFSRIYNEGLGVMAGPRIAALMLRQVAADTGADVSGLMNEINRLTNVIVGGEIIPFDDAMRRKMLDDSEASEAEGAIVFFMVASSMHKRSDLPAIHAGMSKLWDAAFTSLNATEYRRSLPTSTEGGNTGETGAAS